MTQRSRWLLALVVCGAMVAAGFARTPSPMLPQTDEGGFVGQADTQVRRDAPADTQWLALPREQRLEWRARYEAWQALDGASQQRIRQAAADFAGLPVEQQQALRQRFASLDTLSQRGWRLGPELGRDYPALQSLLGFVSEPQRKPLLALLRSLDAGQREQLVRLAQRTPPQDREALRSELLALPAAQRRTWLQQRVGD